MTPSEEIALRKEIEKLRADNELMKKLSSPSGFFEFYFEQLKVAKTNVEAFELANNQYFELFGSFKYVSETAFRHSLRRFYQNKK